MKILISIATYGSKNLKYLNQIIDNYKSFTKYNIDIIVNGTDVIQRNDIKFIQHINPKNTVYFHRDEFVNNLNNYDLFIFSEDDILINEHTIDTYLKYDSKLPLNYILGFLRFERIREYATTKYLIDMWKIPGHPISGTTIKIENESYFSVINPHQSCYILTKDKLKHVIENSNYLIDYNTLGTNILEAASSGIFIEWYHGTGVFKKVLPTDIQVLEQCLVEHLPGNHMNFPPEGELLPGNNINYNPMDGRTTTYTLSNLINLI
jgi:hypothetical protein